MYADYTFYLNDYQGTNTEAVFSRLMPLATAYVIKFTYGKSTLAKGADLLAVKMAFCAIIDELYKQEQGGVVASETNDGMSRTFAQGSVIKTASQRVYSVAETYLSSTNLLYVGV